MREEYALHSRSLSKVGLFLVILSAHIIGTKLARNVKIINVK